MWVKLEYGEIFMAFDTENGCEIPIKGKFTVSATKVQYQFDEIKCKSTVSNKSTAEIFTQK